LSAGRIEQPWAVAGELAEAGEGDGVADAEGDSDPVDVAPARSGAWVAMRAPSTVSELLGALEQPATRAMTAIARTESRARMRTRAFCAGRRGGSTARRIPAVRRYGVKSRV
jgi:hypothetical protein